MRKVFIIFENRNPHTIAIKMTPAYRISDLINFEGNI